MGRAMRTAETIPLNKATISWISEMISFSSSSASFLCFSYTVINKASKIMDKSNYNKTGFIKTKIIGYISFGSVSISDKGSQMVTLQKIGSVAKVL